MKPDLLFRGGLIIDGTGSPPFKADVSVAAGRIRAMGNLRKEGAVRVIDIDGLTLAPDLVDMHSHSDVQLLENPTAEPKVMQGVTTEVIGQDGLSFAPADRRTMNAIREQTAAWNGDAPDVDWEWTSVAEYLRLLDARTSVNVAYLIPHGTVRMLVMGRESRKPTHGELLRMRETIRQGMHEGAVGLSTGLTYPPAMFAQRDELIALCRELVPLGGFFAPHTRSYGKDILQAFEEVIDVSRGSGASLHLTHCLPKAPGNEGLCRRLISVIESLDTRQVDVTVDSYPYTAGSTYLAAFLPVWALGEGTEGTMRTLENPEDAARIRHEMEVEGTQGSHGLPIRWEAIQVSSVATETNRWCEGKRVTEIAELLGLQPFEAVRRLLIAERLALNVLIFDLDERTIREIMGLPIHMAGSDGIMTGGKPHPRAWGTFARYLGHYARDEGLFTLEEIVRKMASLPHRRLGQWDRGLIRPGMWADIVVFDPATVTDTATYDDRRRYPEGIPYVAVNGTLVKDRKDHTGALPGRVLMRSAVKRGAAGPRPHHSALHT
jgi:N-acyl-D-amino-acid deacylase